MYVKSLQFQNSNTHQLYQRLLLVLVFILLATVGAQAQNAYTAAGKPIPTVKSDKDDYAPGEVAIITGSGWVLDSLVDIHLEEDPAHDHHHGYHDTKVNADGTWRIEYQIEERHLGTKFTVVVDGKQSGYQGLAFFTDGILQTVTVGTQVGTASQGTATSVTFNIDLTRINSGSESYNLTVSGLPAGVSFAFGITPLQVNGNSPASASTTLTLTTSGAETANSYNFTVAGTNTRALGDTKSGTGTLVIGGPVCTVPSILSQPVANTVTYGNNTSFTVVASGSVSAYQWQLSTDNGNSWNNITNATTSNYAVESPTVAMSGYLYRAVITGCNTLVISNSAKLIVNQRPISIAVNPKTKVYGTANPVLDGTVSGLLTADDITVNYSTTATTTSDVGTYPITATLSDPANKLGNYTVTNTAANLTVTPASATITLSELSKIYNGTAQGATVTTSPSGLSVNVTYNGTTTVPTDADTYAVAAALTNSNYTATPASGSLVISPRPITIAADAKTKVYGENDPALTYKITAGELVGEDNISGNLSRVAGEAASAYAIQKNTLSAGSNYSLTYTGANLTINPKAITVTPASGQGKIYGSADPALTYTSTALVGNDSFQGALSRESGDQVGTYNITKGSLALSNNYTLNFTDGIKFNITPKSLTATITALDKVYDGNNVANATASVPNADIVGSDVVEVTVSNARFADKNVGQGKTVTAGVSISNSNYSLSNATASATASITAKDITGAFTASDKEYDGSAVATVSGLSLAGVISPDVVQLTGGTAAFADKNADTGKTVTLTGASLSGADKDNYNLTSVATATASISRKPASVTPSASTKVYGQGDPNLQGTLSGFISDDGITAAFNRATGENVGNYAISATLSPAAALGNYNITYNTANLEITKALLTVTADNKTKIYGDANPALTVGYGGFVNNETASVLTQLPVAATTATNSSIVGDYPITVSGGVAANYSLSYVAGTLTINKANIAVAADSKSKTYGDANPAFTGTITGIKNNDAITVSYSTIATAASPVGDYDIVPALAGDALSNYNTPVTTNGKLTITPKAITVTPSAGQSKVYGTTDSVLTYSNTSLVGSDTFTGAITRVAGNNVGTYTINQGTLALSNNYTLTFVEGVQFNITPKSVTASIAAENKTYDGTTTATAAGSVPANQLVGNDAVTVLVSNAAFADKNVGTWNVTANIALDGAAAGNYSLSNATATSSATILAKSLTVSIVASNKVYDGLTTASATGSVPAADLVSGETVNVAVSNANFDNKHVGTGKTVTANVALSGVQSGNYSLSNTTATVLAAITPKDLVVSITATDKVYDGTTAAALNATISDGLIDKDVVTVEATSGAFDNKNAGTDKPVTATISLSGADALNYNANTTAVTKAAITPRPITVAAVAKTKVYGDNDPGLTYEITAGELVAGDAFTGNLNRAIGENVGAYAIQKNTLSAGSNYALTYAGANLTITKAPLTIKANNGYRLCGQANYTFTGVIIGIKLNDAITATYTTVANHASGVGSYDIVPVPAGTALGNYDVTLINGTLMVAGVVADASANSTPQALKNTATTVVIKVTTLTGSAAENVPVKLYFDGATTATEAMTNANGEASFNVGILQTGVFKIKAVAGTDCSEMTVYMPVYDPNGGFVTGGGWIESPGGAYKANPTLTGKAHFGFVAKYKKGTTVPDGNTEFQFQAGNLNFNSSAYDDMRLVISGAKANYKGTGQVNGAGNYGFMVSAIDGQVNGGGGVDKFRIKIWDKNNNDAVVYDNNISNTDENAEPATALGGGSVVIHEVKGTTTKTTTSKVIATAPSETAQFYNYPNTFTDKTTIAFSLDKEESYSLEVYDMRGSLIKKVDMGVAKAGKLYEYEFSGANISKGIYIARLITPSGAKSIKMLLSK